MFMLFLMESYKYKKKKEWKEKENILKKKRPSQQNSLNYI